MELFFCGSECIPEWSYVDHLPEDQERFEHVKVQNTGDKIGQRIVMHSAEMGFLFNQFILSQMRRNGL